MSPGITGATWGGLVHPSLQLPSQPSSVQDGTCPDGRQLCSGKTTQPGRSLSSAHDPGFPQGWLPTWRCAVCHRSDSSCALCAFTRITLHVSLYAPALIQLYAHLSMSIKITKPIYSIGLHCNQQACLVNKLKCLFAFLCVSV